MNYLYLLLDILTIIFPFLLSFDKKVAFYKYWKSILQAIVFIGIPFVVWDMMFTEAGIWGFNPDYLTGLEIGNLPLEEVLFFIVVPYSCTFIYACIKAYFPALKLKGFNKIIYALIAIYAIAILVLGSGGWYSSVVSLLTLAGIPFIQKIKVDLKFLPLSFIIALIPFCIVNGVLTGTGLENPIVWYNDLENAGIRIGTIPVEDVIYGWSLIAGNIIVFQFLNQKGIKKK